MAHDQPQSERTSDDADSKPATRVDRAHARPADGATQPAASKKKSRKLPEQEPVEIQAAVIHGSPSVTASQVRLQATQLATHLQHQQAALDHREAELNARVAVMESQIRAARLWLDERHAELSEREAAIARREVATDGNTKPKPADNPSGQDATDRHSELERREAELQATAQRLAREYGTENGQGPPLAARLAKLEEDERRLSDQQADWLVKFRDLAEQRATFAAFVESERQTLAAERKRALENRQEHQRELKRREAELTTRQGALTAMRAEVARLQQDALEMRLATEELWAQLCRQNPPASLSQSMGQIRLKLAEEFRLAKSELQDQREEIQQLATQLAQQHRRVVDQRAESQTWVDGRLRELEQFAGRVAAREREVEAQRVHFKNEQTLWESERFRLEQEISRLSRLSASERSASAA